MSFKVTLFHDPSLVQLDFPDKIREVGGELYIEECKTEGERKTEDEQIEACRDADHILTNLLNISFERPIIERLDKCKFIETFGAGYNAIDVEAATEHGIGVIHNPGFCREELAETAFALMLACARWVVGLHNRGKEGNPVAGASPEANRHMSIIKGKTLGLIGFGYSGRAMVPKARGFEMRVMVYEGHVDRCVAKELGVEVVSLDQLLKEADFVSLHAKLTPETRHMIGLEEFKKMKRSAFIINTARGAIINEPGLYTALSEGYIAGAGLDVTDPEPPGKDSPLFKFDNVIITGHNAGSSPDSYAALWNFPVEEIGRVIRGEWPVGLVNPEVKQKYVAKWGPMSEPGN
jgi:D-3-phosphoglycerate dehydrogenase